MHWSGWVAAALAVLLGGWLTFDGTRAFLMGDYVTPSSGDHAGQLGPWSRVVAAVGLDPRSACVKGLHVVLGLGWLAAGGCLAAGVPWAREILIGCAVASLWYLPIGTVIAVVELIIAFFAMGRSP
jgi:hypothetical protein